MLTALNPSLANVGVAVCETLMPRYLDKAGVSCERMRHAGRAMAEHHAAALGGVRRAGRGRELRRVFEHLRRVGRRLPRRGGFLAMVPMLGEDVPPEWLGKLFEVIDGDGNSVVTYDEFVKLAPVQPARRQRRGAARRRRGVGVARAREGRRPRRWCCRWRGGGAAAPRRGGARTAMGDLKHLERLGALPIARVDNENAEAVVDRLRDRMRMPDHQVLAIVRAVFVTRPTRTTPRSSTSSTPTRRAGSTRASSTKSPRCSASAPRRQELRELFYAADRDCNGLLDVDEFSARCARCAGR